MTEFFSQWILTITGASILCAAALSIAPKGRVYGTLKMLCGAVMLLALIKPGADFDISAYSVSMARYREHMYQIENNLSETNNRLSRTIIEEECSAYILDKAHVMGMSVDAAVSAKWGDEDCFIPYEVYIGGGQEGRTRLEAVIEADLGIPKERVYWISSESESDGNYIVESE